MPKGDIQSHDPVLVSVWRQGVGCEGVMVVMGGWEGVRMGCRDMIGFVYLQQASFEQQSSYLHHFVPGPHSHQGCLTEVVIRGQKVSFPGHCAGGSPGMWTGPLSGLTEEILQF